MLKKLKIPLTQFILSSAYFLFINIQYVNNMAIRYILFRPLSTQDLKVSFDVLSDKFKGCLVGALLGDCYGRPYKLSDEVSLIQIQKYFDKLDGPYFKAPFKPYSSNSALTKCLAESLVAKNHLNAVDLSKTFVKEFFSNQNRDYGSNLSEIFIKLRGSKFRDPHGPGKEQHFGMGSFGNSAAAIVAPLSLFYHSNEEKMVANVNEMANIINSNKLGRDGALIQSWAIRHALNLNPNNPFCADTFLNLLLEDVSKQIVDEENLQLDDVKKFEKQLFLVQKLLKSGSPTEYDVVSTLGHAKIAVYSVPTAIYCFLRAANSIPGIDTSNQLRRTIQYATALGGDANTIASMAGAIAGAYCGLNNMNQSLQRHCEGISEILEVAEKIANISLNK